MDERFDDGIDASMGVLTVGLHRRRGTPFHPGLPIPFAPSLPFPRTRLAKIGFAPVLAENS